MSKPRTTRQIRGQRRLPDDRGAAALVAGLWRGGLVGVVVLATPLVVLGGFGVFIVLPILAMPVFLVQFTCLVLAPRWAVRRSWSPLSLVLVSHLFSITIWTLLWSVTEYGAAWPIVLGFLVLVHALPAVLQAKQVVRRLRGVTRLDRAARRH